MVNFGDPWFGDFRRFFPHSPCFPGLQKSWIMALSTWTWRHSPVPGDGWVQGTCLWAGDPAGGRLWPFMTLKLVQNSEEMKLKVKESQRQSNARHTSPISSLLEGTCRRCTLQFRSILASHTPLHSGKGMLRKCQPQPSNRRRLISEASALQVSDASLGCCWNFSPACPWQHRTCTGVFFVWGGLWFGHVWTSEICWDWTRQTPTNKGVQQLLYCPWQNSACGNNCAVFWAHRSILIEKEVLRLLLAACSTKVWRI